MKIQPNSLLGTNVLNWIWGLIENLDAEAARDKPTLLHWNLRKQSGGDEPVPSFGEASLVLVTQRRFTGSNDDTADDANGLTLALGIDLRSKVCDDAAKGGSASLPDMPKKTNPNDVHRELRDLLSSRRPIVHCTSLKMCRFPLASREESDTPTAAPRDQ